MTSAEGNLSEARATYRIATEKYFQARNGVDIVEDPDPTSGRRWMPATPRGAMILGLWQKAKAELDAAAAIVQREHGDASCGVCDRTQERMARLPTAKQLAALPHWSDQEAPL